MNSKQRISPDFGKAGVVAPRVNSFKARGLIDILVYSDPVEVVFVYQRGGGLSSYDRVFLTPVNIFS